MRVTIDFDCKDRLLESAYKQWFYNEFERELHQLGRQWRDRLRAHATLHEHYDYVADPADNNRRPIFVENDGGYEPVLLVPEVSVTLEVNS